MDVGLLRVAEDTGGLDDDVDIVLAPRDVVRVLFGEGGDAVAVDRDGFIVVLDFSVEPAQHGVELQQIDQVLVVGQVVDGHDLEVGIALGDCSEETPANAAETINANAGSHVKSLLRDERKTRFLSGNELLPRAPMLPAKNPVCTANSRISPVCAPSPHLEEAGCPFAR